MPRHDFILVFDDDRGRAVGYGGRWIDFLHDDLLHLTDEWDGRVWGYLNPSRDPGKRTGYALGYDGARHEIVLFGGAQFADQGTWVFGVPETACDGADDNANGLVDEGCDEDADGFCDASMTVSASRAVCPMGGGDCDDGAAGTNPGAGDLPADTIDQDCSAAAACDPRTRWDNRGDFVSCVARQCASIVQQGLVSRETCSAILISVTPAP